MNLKDFIRFISNLNIDEVLSFKIEYVDNNEVLKVIEVKDI